jgi:Domain of unknown function DUF1829/Domain of unknown function DUF1828
VIDEISTLVDRYRSWLRDKTALRQINDHIEITTPFLDRHNDFIQIYARSEDGGFLLTDGGNTIDDLSMSGCVLDTPKRLDLLKVALAGFGVKNDNGALSVHATEDTFPLRKHNLIQAILAVNDLFYLAQPYVASVFLEDVIAWLDAAEVRYTPNVKFTGKSGYDHLFDFAIPKSRRAPERLVRAINNPTKDAAQSLAFAWVDTRDVRPADSKAYSILNDKERTIPSSVEEALKSYEVVPVVWSERETARDALAA